MRNFFKKNHNGFGMLEIVVGVSIISFSLFGLASVAQISMRVSEESSYNTKAAFLMEEGVEAVKIMRDTSWVNISALNMGQDYYLNFADGTWATTTSNVFVDGVFERKFVLENINRDANDDIIVSGGTLDAGTKKLTVSVSWQYRNGTTTKSVVTYIADLTS